MGKGRNLQFDNVFKFKNTDIIINSWRISITGIEYTANAFFLFSTYILLKWYCAMSWGNTYPSLGEGTVSLF